MPRPAIVACLLIARALCAGPAEDHLRAIRRVELDPQRCYRVRDVFLEREDVKLYFTDGHLIFGRKVHGRDIAAAFVASEPTDIGEVLLIPPTPGERRSAARFLDETVINEKFRTAVFFFTDDTADALMRAVARSPVSRADAAAGERLAPRWSGIVRNLLGGAALRVFADTYSDAPREAGFFVGAMRGNRLGRFEISIEPRLRKQVGAGRLVRGGEREFYEIWTSFEGRNFREGRRRFVPEPGLLRNYRIEAEIGPDLGMEVRARADFYPQNPRARAFDFELSGRLRVSEVLLDGRAVEFLQKEQPAFSGPSRRRNNLVIAALPEPLQAGSRHELEFRYSGKVISDTGSGVYYVGDRGSWYPRADLRFSRYDLSFRYPAHLELVATGTQVEDSVDDGVRAARFRAETPIRLAGFNLGRYVSTTRRADGYEIEVHGPKPAAPRPRPSAVAIPIAPAQTTLPGRRRLRYGLQPPPQHLPMILDAPPRPPAPRIEEVADRCAAAFRFFLDKFGAPARKRVVVSPVPGDFGQGFPGLVYASTRSYFRPGDPALSGLSAEEARFYVEMLTPHELAHQWWGNVVTVDSPGESWIMEGLATYSSLLFLEHREGRAALDRYLAAYRKRLLQPVEGGDALESAGPVVLGERLRTSKTPQAYRIVAYEKGAWIFHMLRGAMGSEAFHAFLRGLRERFAFRPVTTEDIRREAARRLPAGYPDPELREFFDLWVYRTGIPRLSLEYNQHRSEGRYRLTAKLKQSGVSERFSIAVPVRIALSSGKSFDKYILTEGGETEFSLMLDEKAARAALDPDGLLLRAE